MRDGLNRREFLSRLGALAGAAGLGSTQLLAGCGDDTGNGSGVNLEWEMQAEALEGTMVYDASTAWNGEDRAGSHVPQVTIDGRRVAVVTAHAMTAEHHITAVYLRDADGVVVAMQQLVAPDAGQMLPSAEVSFQLPEGVDCVVAYAHCNLHDVWKSEPVEVGR